MAAQEPRRLFKQAWGSFFHRSEANMAVVKTERESNKKFPQPGVINQGPLVEKRQQPRFTSQFRSTISGGQGEGNGRTRDLSAGGCMIETDMLVAVGASIECRIYVPGLDWPLRID